MDCFISWKKDTDFIGKSAAMAEREAGSARALVAFEVDAEDADVVAYEPVWIDGAVKGFCTSGGYSHYAEKSIALALVPREHALDGQEAEIEILGQMRKAATGTPSGGGASRPLFDQTKRRGPFFRNCFQDSARNPAGQAPEGKKAKQGNAV